MDEIRDPKVVLKEAELLASSPEAVANWLKHNVRWSEYEPADDSLEANLLARKERLIDLALARYGQSEEVLLDLFNRDDEILRVSVLANEKVYYNSVFSIAPFRDGQFDWIAELSNVELKALFSNPKFPSYEIKLFFDMKGAWLVLNESQRRAAAICLIRNMEKWTDTFSAADPSTWESTRLDAARSAWSFADHIEITPPWPHWLGRLYQRLGRPAYLGFDPLQVALRWADAEGEEDTKKDNKNGLLTSRQEVRCGLGRLAAMEAHYDKEKCEPILNHGDVAIRCGAYLVARLSAKEIAAVCKRDGTLAVNHLIRNDWVWRQEDTRDALEEACQKISKGQDWVISLNRDFYRKRDIMSESHPDWFVQNEWSDDEFEERPLTAVSIGELVNRVTSSEAFTALEKSIERMHGISTTRFWVLVAFLAVIAFNM